MLYNGNKLKLFISADTGKFEPERLQLKTEHNQRKQATRTKIDAAKQVQKDLRRVEGEKKLMQDRVTEIQAKLVLMLIYASLHAVFLVIRMMKLYLFSRTVCLRHNTQLLSLQSILHMCSA